MKNIPARERLIAALDVPSAAEARAYAERLGDAVRFYKIGLELFTAGGYLELLAWLRSRGGPALSLLPVLKSVITYPSCTAGPMRSM